MAPKDFIELGNMMEYAITLKSPVFIRYPRGGEAKEKFKTHTNIQYKKCEFLTTGKDVTIIAIGNQVSKAMNIYKKLKQENIQAEVINIRFLKPFDKYGVLKSITKTKFVVTIEDNTLVGGLASEVKDILAQSKLKNIIMKNYGYPDVFVEHGDSKELEQIYKLDEKSILYDIKKNIKYKKANMLRQKKSKLVKSYNNKNWDLL